MDKFGESVAERHLNGLQGKYGRKTNNGFNNAEDWLEVVGNIYDNKELLEGV